MSYGRTPSWVYEQRQAISDASHASSVHRLQDRIAELEKENAELKKKIARIESAFLTATDLLMKKYCGVLLPSNHRLLDLYLFQRARLKIFEKTISFVSAHH